MNELFEIADEFSVFRDGKYIGTHAAKDVTRDDIIRMMVGREITQMFPKEEVPIGDVVLRSRTSPSTASSTTSRSSARGRDPGHGGPGRLGPQQRRRDDLRRDAGDLGHRSRSAASRSPSICRSTAMRHGMAFLTEDRKETGCFLILDVLENMQIAVLQPVLRQGRVRRPERRSIASART